MDKNHANSIAISEIMDKLGVKPQHIGKTKALYVSPVSREQTPNFWVYFKTNDWYDYGICAGGKLTDLAERYLKFTGEDHTIADALRWIKSLSGWEPAIREPVELGSALSIRRIEEISFSGLAEYLEKRGIPLLLARQHMKQLKVFNKNTGRTFLALGVKNENEGYELVNPLFNGFVRVRTITFIRGTKPHPSGVHIFKDMFDYISLLSELDYQAWEDDTVILNSACCVMHAKAYIQNYGYKTMYSWMDNNAEGHRATCTLNSFVKNQPGMVHLKMNKVYENFSSVNGWHMHKCGLSLGNE